MDSDRVLTQVRVVGLLGRFTHTVDFPTSDEFVIIHGPNGVGKTMLLDLVNAIAWPTSLSKIASVPFQNLRLQYADGSVLTVEKPAPRSPVDDRPGDPPVTSSAFSRMFSLTFSLEHASGPVTPLTWSPRLPSEDVDTTSNYMRILSNRTQRPSTAAERTVRNLLTHSSWSDEGSLEGLPAWNDLSLRMQDVLVEQMPAQLRTFLSTMVVHSIDTHRLLGLSATTDESQGRARQRSSLTKVEEFAKDLANRLAKGLAENSRTSQELDRTYPQRLLENPAADVSEQEIRDRYDAQNELRRQLGDISLVDERSSVIEIPERMEPWQRAVLWTYLSDTEAKLDTFRDLLDRVSRLRDIVNSRFLFKHLEIDRERGFRLVSDDGHELGLASLSSGEQHELVLAYDLLFNVPSGALVLIDEPEISLHVSWQKSFISDLRKIASLVRFRTIVATHSPQIAGKWADRMVVLGPGAE